MIIGDPWWVVGTDDQREGHALFRVVGGILIGDTLLAIADGSTGEIRIFARDGSLVRRVGGLGGGPGEFAALHGLWRAPGDTLVAHDAMGAKASVWSPEGELLRVIRFRGDGIPRVSGIFADGSLLGRLESPSMDLPIGARTTDSLTAIRIDTAGDYEVVGRFPAAIQYARGGSRGNAVYAPLLFEPMAVLVPSARDFYIGWPDRWRVERRSITGGHEATIELPGSRAPFTEEMREAFVSQHVARFSSNQQALARRAALALPYPDSLPAYDAMLVDRAGRLWIRHFVGPGQRTTLWTVMESDGEVAGTLPLPVSLRPLDIGADFMVALLQHPDSTERVAVFPLRVTSDPDQAGPSRRRRGA